MDIDVKQYKLNIDCEEYTFTLNMRSALKCEEIFGDFAGIFNSLLKSEKYYTNAFKILSCSCIEKDWDFKDLAEKVSMDVGEMNKIDEIVIGMYRGFELFKKNNSVRKNEVTSQDTK